MQLLSHVQIFATPWTAARQASLSITNSQSLLKLMSIKSVMPSNHLCTIVLCTVYNGAPYFKKSSLCVYFNVLALNYIVGKYVIYERKICPIVHVQCYLQEIIIAVWSTCAVIWWCLHLGGSDGKASAYSVGDLGSIPGSGRSSGEGNGNPLQYSCLENAMDGGVWYATVYGVEKSQTQLSNFTFTFTL